MNLLIFYLIGCLITSFFLFYKRAEYRIYTVNDLLTDISTVLLSWWIILVIFITTIFSVNLDKIIYKRKCS